MMDIGIDTPTPGVLYVTSLLVPPLLVFTLRCSQQRSASRAEGDSVT